MSDLEKNAQEEATKKHPYNLREKKEKKAAYRSLIRPELADELYDRILNIIVVQKKYRDPNYSAKDLAKELQTNTRYLSAVVNSRFGMNYSCLLKVTRPFRVSSIVTSCILTVSMVTTCFKLSVRKIPPLVVSVCSAGAEQLQRRGKNKPSKKIL